MTKERALAVQILDEEFNLDIDQFSKEQLDQLSRLLNFVVTGKAREEQNQ